MKIKHIGFYLNDSLFLAERVMDDLVGYCDMEDTKQGTICHLQIVVDGEVVRCKDCKYWHKDSETELNFCLAFHDEKGGQIIAERDADDFCSRGERK